MIFIWIWSVAYFYVARGWCKSGDSTRGRNLGISFLACSPLRFLVKNEFIFWHILTSSFNFFSFSNLLFSTFHNSKLLFSGKKRQNGCHRKTHALAPRTISLYERCGTSQISTKLFCILLSLTYLKKRLRLDK